MTTINLSEPLRARADRYLERTGISLSNLIAVSLDQFLTANGEPIYPANGENEKKNRKNGSTGGPTTNLNGAANTRASTKRGKSEEEINSLINDAKDEDKVYI